LIGDGLFQFRTELLIDWILPTGLCQLQTFLFRQN
jgi:hypothetical protein